MIGRQTLNPDLTTGEIPGTVYGLSQKGWINRELFLSWFYDHFLPLIPPGRPVLLLLDGHSSHYSPDVIRLAAEEKVLLFILPPNTTHLSQPLDRGCFSPLKSHWKSTCYDFCTNNPGRIVSRFDFSNLFAKAWKAAMTPGNIVSSFSVTGVYPYNPDKVLSKIKPKEQRTFTPQSLAKRTGLAYIPLYSPAPEYDSDDDPHDMDDYSPGKLDRSLSESDLHRSTYTSLRRATSVSRFLITPKKPKPKGTVSCGKVLTSIENMREMEEKERRKAEEQKGKEERKAKREVKKAGKVFKGICTFIEFIL